MCVHVGHDAIYHARTKETCRLPKIAVRVDIMKHHNCHKSLQVCTVSKYRFIRVGLTF